MPDNSKLKIDKELARKLADPTRRKAIPTPEARIVRDLVRGEFIERKDPRPNLTELDADKVLENMHRVKAHAKAMRILERQRARTKAIADAQPYNSAAQYLLNEPEPITELPTTLCEALPKAEPTARAERSTTGAKASPAEAALRRILGKDKL